MAVPFRVDDPAEEHMISQLRESLGDFFAEKLAMDGAQARGIMAGGAMADL